MSSIQVKDVPEDVHRVLRERAGQAHQSLQEYLLDQLSRLARQPTMAEVLQRVDDQVTSNITLADIVADLRQARESL